MLKNIKNKLRKRQKSELNVTPGENGRDAIIKAGIKAAEESGDAAGNTTEKLGNIASGVGNTVDRGTELIGGSTNRNKIQEFAVKHALDTSSPDAVQDNLLECLEYMD